MSNREQATDAAGRCHRSLRAASTSTQKSSPAAKESARRCRTRPCKPRGKWVGCTHAGWGCTQAGSSQGREEVGSRSEAVGKTHPTTQNPAAAPAGAGHGRQPRPLTRRRLGPGRGPCCQGRVLIKSRSRKQNQTLARPPRASGGGWGHTPPFTQGLIPDFSFPHWVQTPPAGVCFCFPLPGRNPKTAPKPTEGNPERAPGHLGAGRGRWAGSVMPLGGSCAAPRMAGPDPGTGKPRGAASTAGEQRAKGEVAAAQP